MAVLVGVLRNHIVFGLIVLLFAPVVYGGDACGWFDRKCKCHKRGGEWLVTAYVIPKTCECTKDLKRADLCMVVGSTLLMNCPAQPVMGCRKLSAKLITKTPKKRTDVPPWLAND